MEHIYCILHFVPLTELKSPSKYYYIDYIGDDLLLTIINQLYYLRHNKFGH